VASLIIKLTFFPLSLYMLESSRLTPFTLQLNQAVFYPHLSLTTREINLPAKTHSFKDVASGHLENQGQHLLWDMHSATHFN
jgi:hypothetical protein